VTSDTPWLGISFSFTWKKRVEQRTVSGLCFLDSWGTHAYDMSHIACRLLPRHDKRQTSKHKHEHEHGHTGLALCDFFLYSFLFSSP
jgi:hypothetical protein